MNAAWSDRQAVHHLGVRKASLCCNPVCDERTYPDALQPEGAAKYCRQVGDPENHLALYLCGVCFRYRSRHGNLPGPDDLAKVANLRQTCAAAGPDAGVTYYTRKDGLHKDLRASIAG